MSTFHPALRALTLLFALAATAITSHALPRTYELGSVVVSQQNSGSGLIIETAPVFSTSPFVLDDGESALIDLFDIWTPESSVNAAPGNDDDLTPRPFQVTITFTNPVLGTTFDGDTVGISFMGGLFQQGRLLWDNPVQTFTLADRTFQLELEDAQFNSGLFMLFPGRDLGDRVSARVTQVSSRTSVPDAGSTSLLLLAGLGTLLVARRASRL